MMEEIITVEELNDIQRKAWHAGHANVEPYALIDTCGEEVIRCRDCKRSHEKGWKCDYWVTGRWYEEEEADIIELADVEPDGFCFKAERREA